MALLKTLKSKCNSERAHSTVKPVVCFSINKRAPPFIIYSKIWPYCFCSWSIIVNMAVGKKLCGIIENWGVGEAGAKSSKGNKSSFKHAGNKASAASQTRQLVANQPARPLCSPTEAGSRSRPSREIERDKERGSFHYTKTLILLLLPPSLVLSCCREILWVKVTDTDNCISGRPNNYYGFYYCFWQPHICRRYNAIITVDRVCVCRRVGALHLKLHEN